MSKNKLGIIGGMGPEATVNFYNRIVKHTKASKDQDHIDMIILNHASLMDRTYAIKNNKKSEFLNQISEDIKILEYAEVDNIAIPCNTCHTFLEDIQSMTSIPIINMIEETCKSLDNRLKIGLMATEGTINSNLYQKWFNEFNINYFLPESSIQNKIMEIIYNDAKANGIYDNNKFEMVLKYFINQNNCDLVILGCTELSQFKNNFNEKTIDPMDYLVKASIERTNGIYKL